MMDIDNQQLYSTNPLEEYREAFACRVGDGAQRGGCFSTLDSAMWSVRNMF